MGHIADQCRIVARDEGKALSDIDAQLAHPVHGAGGVLDADDIGQLRQANNDFVAHVDDGAARHVVKQSRNLNMVVQGFEMLIQTFLRRLVVIGRDNENSIGADGLGVMRQLQHFGGVVRARAGDHLDPAGGFFDAALHQVAVFFHAQRRGLARRADRHKAVHTRGDLILDQTLEGGEIDAAVGERRHHRGDHPVKQRLVRPSGHGLEFRQRNCVPNAYARHRI